MIKDGENDDVPVGRVLTRREILRLLGATGVDGIFDETLLLAASQTAEGYQATFDIALDLSDTDTGQPDSGGGPDGGPGGGPGGAPPPPPGG